MSSCVRLVVRKFQYFGLGVGLGFAYIGPIPYLLKWGLGVCHCGYVPT